MVAVVVVIVIAEEVAKGMRGRSKTGGGNEDGGVWLHRRKLE